MHDKCGTIVTIDNSGRLTNKLNPSPELHCTTNKGVEFYLLSYNNGILKIEPKVNTDIKKFANMVDWLFDPSSNFFGIERVEFEFNGIPISVLAKESADIYILKQYRDKCKNREHTSK